MTSSNPKMPPEQEEQQKAIKILINAGRILHAHLRQMAPEADELLSAAQGVETAFAGADLPPSLITLLHQFERLQSLTARDEELQRQITILSDNDSPMEQKVAAKTAIVRMSTSVPREINRTYEDIGDMIESLADEFDTQLSSFMPPARQKAITAFSEMFIEKTDIILKIIADYNAKVAVFSDVNTDKML